LDVFVSASAGGSKSPLDVAHVPVGGEQPYKFEIRATIVNPAKIVSVKSPKDDLNVKLNDDRTEAQVRETGGCKETTLHATSSITTISAMLMQFEK